MSLKHYSILWLSSAALLGLISIQIYWVNEAIDSKEDAFSHSITQVLDNVANKVEQQEMNKYVSKFIELKEKNNIADLESSLIRDFVFIQENKKTKETFIYQQGILEKDYKISNDFFNIPKSGTTHIKNYVSKQFSRNLSEKNIDNKNVFVEENSQKSKRFSSFDKVVFQELFKEISLKLSIIERIDKNKFEALLKQELLKQNIRLKFEYAIYDQLKQNSLQSEKFNEHKASHFYSVPILKNEDTKQGYTLKLYFPHQKRHLLSTIMLIAIGAFIFTSIIVWIFIRTYIQMHTQKQISEMKTDFINNMTHEFKTPIATSKLAIEAIQNPIVFQDEEKKQLYFNILRDENKRMLDQVENILQISRLEKKNIEFEKEIINLHEIIENAILHIQLLLEQKNGSLRKHFTNESVCVLTNELYLTNVFVNILENAVKYSANAPEIDIFTEIQDKYVLIKIQDKGIGIHKNVLKKIFEKFYREHTGNLHNVKGHGLGLAYAKKIIEQHKGEIYVESEKGKGSIFFIKIPR